MTNKTPKNKISKEDLLNCKYIKDPVITGDGKIKFYLQLMSWKVRDGNANKEMLEVTCPNVDMISYKSFSPPHYNNLLMGEWLSSLIERKIIPIQEEPYHELLLEQSIKEFYETINDNEPTEGAKLQFMELVLRKIKQYERP